MSLFYHDNRSIPYRMEFAPTSHDLLLLQSSRYTMDFWKPVLDNLNNHPPSQGRVIVCEWFDKSLSEEQLATHLNALIKTLGLNALHVVACDDAVDVVAEVEKINPGRFENTLLYPQSVPRPDDLSRAIREFSRI